MRLSSRAIRSVSRARPIFVLASSAGDRRVVRGGATRRRSALWRAGPVPRTRPGWPSSARRTAFRTRRSERPGREVRGAGVGRPLVLDHPQPADPRAGLDEVLDLAAADVDAELAAVDDGDLDLVRAALAAVGDELFGQRPELPCTLSASRPSSSRS